MLCDCYICFLQCCCHVALRYQGTGKQFFIGMWEGDHALRVPGKWGHHVPPDAGRMEVLQYVLKEKQRAVDDAKRVAGDCQHVGADGY